MMKMMHSLDKPSSTLDAKWADMQEQLAGNKDVRYLFAVALFPMMHCPDKSAALWPRAICP